MENQKVFFEPDPDKSLTSESLPQKSVTLPPLAVILPPLHTKTIPTIQETSKPLPPIPAKEPRRISKPKMIAILIVFLSLAVIAIAIGVSVSVVLPSSGK